MKFSKILITGDSLSYNRYSYEDVFCVNSFDSPVNMKSWSFKLRDYVISSTKFFTYGADLNVSKIKFDDTVFDSLAYNGNDSCKFYYPYKTNTLTLYLQKHQDGEVYDIDIDNGFDSKKINFKGNENYYRSREIFSVTFNADENLDYHVISFTGKGAFTLLGISVENKEVIISGKGSQKTVFFLDNYDDYIGKYDFDLAFVILGANDLNLKTSLEDFELNYSTLLDKISLKTKNVVLLTPSNIMSKSTLKKKNLSLTDNASYKYIEIIKKLAKKYDCKFLDTYSIFENLPTDAWRFDNVHFNRLGNDLLYKKVLKLLDNFEDLK